MHRRTRDALEGSIEKWRGIVAGKKRNCGTRDCPLCHLFFRVECGGCPVSAASGAIGCRNTPFEEYISRPGPATARAELDFLISLRPKRKAPRRKMVKRAVR